jgi:ParB-like chromosome segregation protein Spo0J
MAQIEYLSSAALKPARRNARTHSRKQIRQIAASIERFGFTNPVLIDERAIILAGHGRVEAAKLLGLPTVPCMRLENMSEADKRAYALADNKLALNAGWDDELLAMELQDLLAADLGFDVGITGFTIAEVDRLIDGLAPVEDGDPALDALPDPAQVPLRCRPGDVWQLGVHRLVCGRPRPPNRPRPHGRRIGGDGLHRSSLQCGD